MTIRELLRARESGVSMTGPLLLLAAGSIGIGYFGSDFASLSGGSYHFHLGMSGMLGTACALVGLLLSWLIYGSRQLSPQAFSFLAPIGRLARSGLVDRYTLTQAGESTQEVAVSVGVP